MMKAYKKILVLSVCLMLLTGCGGGKHSDTETLPSTAASEEAAATESPLMPPEDISRSYYYNLLSEKEKEYYGIMKRAVLNFQSAQFPEKLPRDTLRKIFITLYTEEEEIFWLVSTFYGDDEPSDRLPLFYSFTPEQAEKMAAETKEEVDRIISSLDSNLSDYEKVRFFHDYIVTHCSYDKEKTVYSDSAYGALILGGAQCMGYSFAFEQLCGAAGIDCFTVMGADMNKMRHAWNIVTLDGQRYHVDCTYDDPILDSGDEDFVRHYFFLVNDSDILGISHLEDSTYFSLPSCTASDNYYVREGLLASDCSQGVDMLENALKAGEKSAAVRFDNESSFNEAKSRLFDRGEIESALAQSSILSDAMAIPVKYINEDLRIIQIAMITDNKTPSE